MFRFDIGEPLSRIGDIIASMAAHRRILNGRVVSHFFVSLFEMLPKMLFNLVNAALFAALLVMLRRIAEPERHNNLVLIMIFAALWLFTQAFGEVCLRPEGSPNYLRDICANLLFLLVMYFAPAPEN